MQNEKLRMLKCAQAKIIKFDKHNFFTKILKFIFFLLTYVVEKS